MKEILKLTLISLLFSSINIYSQEFYVNIVTAAPPYNEVIKFNVSNTNETANIACIPTANPNQQYGDIAIDASNNLYYVTGDGGLYKRNNINLTCEYLGSFNGTINSLTADSGHLIYGVGYLSSTLRLFKYDINSGIFTVDNLPSGYLSGGDLFFYENKLFLTTTASILEINLTNPSQSCNFMNISTPGSMHAAFSINFGTYSKAYILSKQVVSSSFVSYLQEVDMVNRQLGNTIRAYNYNIYGAAAFYNLTSTNSSCIPILSTEENNFDNDYLNVINPAKSKIICQTNLKRSEIISIRLYDNLGRLIKDFSNHKNIESLDILGIPSGNYLLTLSTKNGKTYTKKIIIES